jgi:hypothetical protein
MVYVMTFDDIDYFIYDTYQHAVFRVTNMISGIVLLLQPVPRKLKVDSRYIYMRVLFL